MEAYTGFAKVYDEFMDNVSYDEWGLFIHETLLKAEISEGILLDLGCGTGSMTEILAGYGYDMIGVDGSAEMLEIAEGKRRSQGIKDILYLCQDMREFELYGTVRAVVSVCDSLNYILNPDELLTVFKLVNNYLDPGGLLFFDFNTEYKYKEVLGEQTIAENREDASFIWENYYDEEERINEYALTLFVKDTDGRFLRHQEEHYQRAYTLEEIKDIIKAAGMEFLTAYDDYSYAPAHAYSERICVVAREKGKFI